VKGLLQEEQFTYKGEHYEFNECTVYPQPLQRPLPIWVVAQSPQTFIDMGTLGANLLIPIPGYHGGIQTWDATKERLSAYRKAWKDAGHPGTPKVIVRAPVFLADTKEQALDVARRTVTMFRFRFRHLTRQQNQGAYSEDPRSSGAFFGVGAEEITGDEFPVDVAVERATIAGTAQDAIAKIERIQEDLEAYGVLIEPEITASSLREDRIRTMRIVADRVMAKFK
jgi:alkanesulfonate monooxygenase SsuD/methylene tetrahydromethanopterin reductase-like flavin-dependent oxidoreductase (luciferase family)